MSRNIFKILEKEDSDDEKPKVEHKPSQKEQRVIAQQQRAIYSTDNAKEDRASKKLERKPKDNYAPGEKRPYDRHSGTGKPAFGTEPKKQGFGKGNVGKPQSDVFVKKGKAIAEENAKQLEKAQTEEESVATAETTKPEEKEELITLDAFAKTTGAHFGLEAPTTTAVFNKKAPVATVDPDLKPMPSKKTGESDVSAPKKRRDPTMYLNVPSNKLLDSEGVKPLPQGKSSKGRSGGRTESFPSLLA